MCVNVDEISQKFQETPVPKLQSHWGSTLFRDTFVHMQLAHVPHAIH